MKKEYVIWMAVIAFLAICATAAFAKPGGMMQHHGKPQVNALALLDLNADQIEKLRNLRISHEEALAPLKRKEERLNSELRILWLQMTPNIGEIKSVQRELHDTKFQRLQEDTAFRMALRDLLTEKQLSRYLALGGSRCPGPDQHRHRPPRP